MMKPSHHGPRPHAKVAMAVGTRAPRSAPSAIATATSHRRHRTVGKLDVAHRGHRTHLNMAIETHWPLFALRVRTPRLELRYPDDDDVVALAELGARGVHEPDFMPFTTAWTDAPSPEQERNTLQHYWLQPAQWAT